jgi:NADPH2:quinone reductase
VIATAGSEAKLELARAHGADHGINYREREFRDEVLALTDGRGVDAVYDPVGGEVFMQSLRCMAPEARIMPVGFAGGDIPQIPANILLVKNLIVCGLNMGLYYGWSPNDMRYHYEDRVRANMDKLFNWFVAGRINPVVDTTYPLSKVQQAMDDVLTRRALGRIAVVMDEEAQAAWAMLERCVQRPSAKRSCGSHFSLTLCAAVRGQTSSRLRVCRMKSDPQRTGVEQIAAR